MVHIHFVAVCPYFKFLSILHSLEERQLQTQGQRISICLPFPPLQSVISVPSVPYTTLNSGSKRPAAVYILVLWQCCLHTAQWLSHCCFLTICDVAHCGLALFPAEKSEHESMRFTIEPLLQQLDGLAVVQPLVFGCIYKRMTSLKEKGHSYF